MALANGYEHILVSLAVYKRTSVGSHTYVVTPTTILGHVWYMHLGLPYVANCNSHPFAPLAYSL